jgi:regulator of replication initiation timing
MISQREMFDRLVDLEKQKLVLAEDIAQLKKDAKYDEDENPQGISKEDIKLIGAAAKLQAKNDYEEKREAATAVFKKYEELVDYQ